MGWYGVGKVGMGWGRVGLHGVGWGGARYMLCIIIHFKVFVSHSFCMATLYACIIIA